MVQGVPDDNNLSEKPTSDTPINTDTVEDITQSAAPITEAETSAEVSSEAEAPDVTPTPTTPLGTLHLLSYLLWEREGIATFEVTRADLLDTITTLFEQLQSSTDAVEQLKHVILGGQTVLIEDIAAVRSDLIALLAIYNAGGRFGIGPWYIQVDNLLVSGESLIRNLLLGRNDVIRHGIELVNVAFMPSLVDHISQLPQILAGFDITAMMLTSPEAILSLPFRWVAPDGSHILVVNHHDGAEIVSTIEDQKFGQPDGPFLWLNSINENTDLNTLEMSSLVKHPIRQSTLADYFEALRQGLPDTLRPALKGELRLMGPGYQLGRLSTRMYLKQANSRLQSLLTYQTEPWLAIALTDGALKSPLNVRALLDYGWRELMKNQSRNNLSGCSDDTVTQETEIRNQRIHDVTQRIQDVSLDALPGTLTRTMSYDQQKATREETYIGVWNSHSFTAEQVVEIPLMLPDGKYPETLTNPDGREIDFSWDTNDESDYSCIIGFRARVSAVGYTVYTLKLGDNKPQYTVQTNKGQAIAKTNGETLIVEKGQLLWSRPNRRISDFLSFHDSGDAGDTYDYRKPQPDVSVRAGMTDMVTVESTPTYQRLIFRERMRIAPELKDDLSRSRGLSLLDITTTATVYDGIPGIYFRTKFTNKAKDHRLRAHFRTGLKTSQMLTDTAFGLTTRQIVSDSTHIAAHPQVNIFPLQTLASVTGEEETLVLMTRGLTEVEPILEKDEVTLALTLLRSVGWLQRGDDTTHGIPAKGAQYERDVVVEYAILPMPTEDNAAMLRAAQTYTAPLQAFQYHEKPDPLQQNYLSFDNDRVVMTALKPPQTGEGWIVRFINPTDEEVNGKLTTHSKLKSAKLVNLAEEDQAEYNITKNTINLNIEPHKIHTIRLEFN
jgi:alpha-mannosidase